MNAEMRPPEERRLKSWKEIAAFLGCDERTAKRWETSRGLPVRRLQTGPRSGVFAFPSELQDWLREKEPPESLPAPGAGQSPVASTPVLSEAPKDAFWLRRFALAAGCLLILAVAVLSVGFRFSARPAVSPAHVPPLQAQAFYRAGLEAWQERTPESLTRAVDQFTQAIVQDPQYAAAYAGLANCYNLLREYTAMPSAYAFPRAKAAAERAIALDPSLADAHLALAFVDFYWSYNSNDAAREFEKAIALQPDNVTAHQWYANVLGMRRQFPQALAEIDKAQQLDPESNSVLADKGLILFHAGRVEEADVLLRQLEQSAPNLYSTHGYLAAVAVAKGDNEDFLRELGVAAKLQHNAQLSAIVAAGADGLAHGGGTGMFRALLKIHEQLLAAGQGDAYPVASLYALLGNTQEAITYLRLSLSRHETQAVALNVGPEFRALHKLPEFRRLVREAGFTPDNHE